LFQLDKYNALYDREISPIRKIDSSEATSGALFLINRLSSTKKSQQSVWNIDGTVYYDDAELKYKDAEEVKLFDLGNGVASYAIDGKDVYYQTYVEVGPSNPIIKKDIISGKEDILFTPDSNVGRIWIFDDTLVYILTDKYERETNLYSYDLKEKQNVKLSDERVLTLAQDGNYLYYNCLSKKGIVNVYRQRVHGSAAEVVNNDEGIKKLWGENAHGGWIYYQDFAQGNALYRFNLKTNEMQRLSGDDGVDTFVICEDRIYYIPLQKVKTLATYDSERDYAKLYRMDLDGSNKQIIANDVKIGSSITTADGGIYYHAKPSSDDYDFTRLMRIDAHTGVAKEVAQK